MPFPRLLATLAILLVAVPAIAQQRPDLRVMSFNVRYAGFDDSPNAWPNRRGAMTQTIAAADPDLIATQELLQVQGDDIVRALPSYNWFGVDRYGGHKDEHMGLFYRRDRLRLLRSGGFGLSEMPDKLGTMSWGTDLPRNATWGVFETRSAKRQRFLLIGTHFAHRPQDDAARDKAATLILDRLPALAKGLPVIVAGDLNTLPDSAPYRRFAAALTDAWVGAGKRIGQENTFHDFTGTADRRIDYIFVKRFTPTKAQVWDQPVAGRWPSDHFPVTADLSFSPR